MSTEKIPPDLVKPSWDLFLITRTTNRYGSPHEDAFKVSIPLVDERTVDCPSKVRAGLGKTDWWYNHGTNHRVENGHIKRDEGYNRCWAIRIPSMDELMSFIQENGKCVVSIDTEGYQCIEIYDTYRE